MVLPTREAIETFISITGASEDVAVRKLEEHGGDLNDAVNAHFSEVDRNNNIETEVGTTVHDDMMDVDDPVSPRYQHPVSSLLSSARNLNPFSLLDPIRRGSLLGHGSDFSNHTPFISHPREVREIPIEVMDKNEPLSNADVPTIEDVTDTEYAHGPEIHGTVIVEDEDDTGISSALPARDLASAPEYDTSTDYSNDIEEEMIQAAIEASKREAEIYNQKLPAHDSHQEQFPKGKNELLHADSSYKRVTEERGIPGRRVEGELDAHKSVPVDGSAASNGRLGEIIDDLAESIDQTNRHVSDNHMHQNGSVFPLDEWGGISSEEHDEAVMLEAAMFGGISEDSATQGGSSSRAGPYTRRTPRPPSPSLESQRLIREQQDDEYLASLQADQEKELKAVEEAQSVLAEEKRKEEESCKRMVEQQERERQLAAKEASLPQEPALEDENAITLLVRMPDGIRCGRRFLKSHKLQSLFDFIDVKGGIKPGSYKLVRPYPRQAFGDGEMDQTLNELGLTSKQEALFLQII